jgi:SPP1 gp7 family putative phage head morphogenesis protein
MEQHLYQNLKDLSKAESDWQIKTLNDSTPIQIDFVAPAPKVLKALVENSPMNGALISEWFAKLADDTAFKVNQQIQIGVINGEGIEDIVRRIKGTRAAQYSDGILNISRNNLRAVVRTSVSNISDIARKELYSENADMLNGIQIHETLDTRTCEECMALDGQVFEVDNIPEIPHWQCRRTTIPVLKSW